MSASQFRAWVGSLVLAGIEELGFEFEGDFKPAFDKLRIPFAFHWFLTQFVGCGLLLSIIKVKYCDWLCTEHSTLNVSVTVLALYFFCFVTVGME